MRITVINIFEKIPYVVKVLPYTIALFVIKLQFKLCFKNIKKCWARNSYTSKNIVFALSDLDLSVLWKQYPSKVEILRINRALKFSKHIFPFIGELNHYIVSSIESMPPLMNPFELERDPVLASMMNQKKQASKIDAIVYISKMIYYDRKGLLTYPELRQKKWKFHLNSISKVIEAKSDIFIGLNFLVNLLVSEIPNQSREELTKIFESQIDLEDRSLLKNRSFITLFPNLWIGNVFMCSSNIENEKSFLNELDQNRISIIKANLEWELCGLYTQFPAIEDLSGLIRHLTHLKLLYKFVSSNSDEQIFSISTDNLIGEIQKLI